MDILNFPNRMLGAACGDIAGSRYEFHNIKYCLREEELIDDDCCFTDDTVMTCAVAQGLVNGFVRLQQDGRRKEEDVLLEEIKRSMQLFGRKYPYAGYGGRFRRWITANDPEPYNSWGNGSAMRASYAGWAAGSLEEAEWLAEISAKVTHNHPEGIKGAQAVAGSIFILRNGGGKEQVEQYVSGYYDLNFTLDEIREEYSFDVSCPGSVPQAVRAFLEGENFSDVIARAISIGGDSDTIAAIAGSIAEVIYPIPEDLKKRTVETLDDFLLDTLKRAVDALTENKSGIGSSDDSGGNVRDVTVE